MIVVHSRPSGWTIPWAWARSVLWCVLGWLDVRTPVTPTYRLCTSRAPCYNRAVTVRGTPSASTGVTFYKRGVRQLFNMPRHNGPCMEDHASDDWSTNVTIKTALVAAAVEAEQGGHTGRLPLGAAALVPRSGGKALELEEFHQPVGWWTCSSCTYKVCS